MKSIDKQLDKAWSEAVKRRDKKCIYCGKETYLNAHHIFGRRKYSTRWDIENGITLCSCCHTSSSTFSAHQTPLEFVYWLEKLKGVEWIDKLRIKANKPYKLTLSEKKELLKKIRS